VWALPRNREAEARPAIGSLWRTKPSGELSDTKIEIDFRNGVVAAALSFVASLVIILVSFEVSRISAAS
jgi:hypothetical protein